MKLGLKVISQISTRQCCYGFICQRYVLRGPNVQCALGPQDFPSCDGCRARSVSLKIGLFSTLELRLGQRG